MTNEHWIIVGAGSAGCVLANRLSADPLRQVTLLDDGPDLLPGNVPSGIAGPSFFEAMAEPERMHAALLATRVTGGEATLYQRGRGIGGSSAVNAMVALRGSTNVYRRWGWSDVDEAWDRLLIPTTAASADEVGAVDLALRTDPRCHAADLTRRAGSRVTSAEAYLWPVLDRDNLNVRPESEVATIIFEERTAIGVRLTSGEELRADRVVLSSGAIHSPTILLRSGVDTPGVGAHLQEHPSAVFTLQLQSHVPQDQTAVSVASALHHVVDDNLLQLLPMSHLGPAAETAGLGALMAALMTPVSSAGSVTIDEVGNPVVNFALLDNPHDLAGLTNAIQLAMHVLRTPAFEDILEAVYIDDLGTVLDELTNDGTIAEWLRAHCGDYVHASSTCAMGTVVDSSGALYGYNNIMVCDASVFPSIPDANTHFPTTMLAERLATRLR